MWLFDTRIDRRRWLQAASGLLLSAAALASGCSGEPTGGQAQAARPQVIPVTASPALRRTVPVELRANGTAQAYATVSVTSQVDGLVVSQLLTLYITPVVYLSLERLRVGLAGRLRRRPQAAAGGLPHWSPHPPSPEPKTLHCQGTGAQENGRALPVLPLTSQLPSVSAAATRNRASCETQACQRYSR